MPDVRRIHLVVDIVDDGTDMVQVARDLLAGRRPDARVVDTAPDLLVGDPDRQALPTPEAVFVVLEEDPQTGQRGGFVLERPAFLWARPIYSDSGPPEFKRLEFGGQCREYGFALPPKGDSLEDVVDALVRMHHDRRGAAGQDDQPGDAAPGGGA